jgi:hypothetical protein
MAEDYCFRYDLIDPETKAPLELKDGAIGEAIHTALEYEAAPAFRNATGDILKLHVGECPGCGHFGVRMDIIAAPTTCSRSKASRSIPPRSRMWCVSFSLMFRESCASGLMRRRLRSKHRFAW